MIKRYSILWGSRDILPVRSGEWVKYEDHESEIASIKQQLRDVMEGQEALRLQTVRIRQAAEITDPDMDTEEGVRCTLQRLKDLERVAELAEVVVGYGDLDHMRGKGGNVDQLVQALSKLNGGGDAK